MAEDITDYIRGFDLNEDWGMTPVTKPAEETNQPSIDPSVIEKSN